MTIALAIKVNDGVVLSADSATTMMQTTEDGGERVINIYNNANKVFNLHKRLPIGLITWGKGNIGRSSLTTLIKDFRERITFDKDHKVDEDNYTIHEIAYKFYDFIYTEKYTLEYTEPSTNSAMGFLIAGYSSDADDPEMWLIKIDQFGQCERPEILGGYKDTGWYADGQPEAITRLIKGFSPNLGYILEAAEIEKEKIDLVMGLIQGTLPAQIIQPAMPIQDAIDIAKFLVETTINYVRYSPGHQTVGGPIEIAAITKHEGYKWINRKYYFTQELNPREA